MIFWRKRYVRIWGLKKFKINFRKKGSREKGLSFDPFSLDPSHHTKEWNNKIIFLHKLVPGGVNHSYGIQVASLAGLPGPVVSRAREILANLETGELDEIGMPRLAHSKAEKAKDAPGQLQLFHTGRLARNASKLACEAGGHDEVIESLKEAAIDVMTPIEALNLIHKLKAGL